MKRNSKSENRNRALLIILLTVLLILITATVLLTAAYLKNEPIYGGVFVIMINVRSCSVSL